MASLIAPLGLTGSGADALAGAGADAEPIARSGTASPPDAQKSWRMSGICMYGLRMTGRGKES